MSDNAVPDGPMPPEAPTGQPAQVRVLLSPVQAELVRMAEQKFRQAQQAAFADRQRTMALVLAEHQVSLGSQWSINEVPEGIALTYPAPPKPEGDTERTLVLVPGNQGAPVS